MYSVIIPVYNSERSITEVVKQCIDFFVIHKFNYEIILVNDNSTDNSKNILQSISENYRGIKLKHLKKNIGQHAAVLEGMKQAEGKFLITLDDDLQNPPEEMIKLILRINDGFDVVFGCYVNRTQPFIRKAGGRIVQFLNRLFFMKNQKVVVSNFRIFTRSVAEKMLMYDSTYPYIQGLLLVSSSKTGNVDTVHQERAFGHSNYSYSKLFFLFIKIIYFGLVEQHRFSLQSKSSSGNSFPSKKVATNA